MTKTVLVVEDSALLQKAYGTALASYPNAKLEVLYASNGAEALEKLSQSPLIDLIILDVNMPVMEGTVFLEHLRRDYAAFDIPVILASTRAYATRAVLGPSAGIAACLQKPFAPRELHGLLDGIWSAANK
ncbi:MAG TPA: response regulator [Gemmatimonadaceae bacterium]|nr:response regulator [Gemmatimonadaceae bacterium]